MKVKELLEPVNQEQSKEILRAELVRRKIQIKMGQFGLWRRKKEFERSSRLFLKLVEEWGAESKRARGRRSFAGDVIFRKRK